MKYAIIICISVCVFAGLLSAAAVAQAGYMPGERVLFEAHNCYPYHGLWNNRIDKALESGLPLAIEIDVMWFSDAETGSGRLVVAHSEPLSGEEPTLQAYFFERIRPIVEKALADNDTKDWPIITLNINDIRSNNPNAYDTVKSLTETYAAWLCSTTKGADDAPAPLDTKPVLVLTTGGSQAKKTFYDDVEAGQPLRLFGAGDPDTDADNFHRWINYSWSAVEPEGQSRAKDWTDEKAARLQSLVENAHKRGYWIRFYSLNGHPVTATARLGLSPGYNFGAIEKVRIRWEAAVKAGVDFIATDQINETDN